MKRVRYPAEFKAEAVRQVTDRGHGVVDVAKRLGMSDKVFTYGCVLQRTEQAQVVKKLRNSKRKYRASKQS